LRAIIAGCFEIKSQCKDRREGVIWEDLGAVMMARAREFWMIWRRFSWYSGR